MEHRIDKWSGKIDASAVGAAFAVAGKLQIYVCHDGTLEVYVDGQDIKELIGIDVSSTWFDFGEAVLAVEKNPGEETEARPKDFGKDTITRAEADERRKRPVEEKGGISDQYFNPMPEMIASIFGVDSEFLNTDHANPPKPGDPEFEIPF